jgi:hypothetical protein
MMAAARVMKASWMSSRISQRMCRRRNQCSSAIVGSIIYRCAPRHLLQVTARGGPASVVRSMDGLRPLGTRAPG